MTSMNRTSEMTLRKSSEGAGISWSIPCSVRSINANKRMPRATTIFSRFLSARSLKTLVRFLMVVSVTLRGGATGSAGGSRP